MSAYMRTSDLVKMVRKLMAGRKSVTLPLDDPKLKGLKVCDMKTRWRLWAHADVEVVIHNARFTVTIKKEQAA